MSFWSDLWVGDAGRIGAYLDDEEREDDLRTADFVLAHVKLPGVLPGLDDAWSPDRLTAIACDVARPASGEITFAGVRGQHLAGDPDQSAAEWGAFEIEPVWIQLFAELDDVAVSRIGERWAAAYRAESGIPVAPEDVFVERVGEIREVCRIARARGAAVVYSFTL